MGTTIKKRRLSKKARIRIKRNNRKVLAAKRAKRVNAMEKNLSHAQKRARAAVHHHTGIRMTNQQTKKLSDEINEILDNFGFEQENYYGTPTNGDSGSGENGIEVIDANPEATEIVNDRAIIDKLLESSTTADGGMFSEAAELAELLL